MRARGGAQQGFTDVQLGALRRAAHQAIPPEPAGSATCLHGHIERHPHCYRRCEQRRSSIWGGGILLLATVLPSLLAGPLSLPTFSLNPFSL